MACDFTALVQPGNYSVTAFPAQPGDYSVALLPAQNGFCTSPVAHHGHELALLVSASYPSTEQLLKLNPGFRY